MVDHNSTIKFLLSSVDAGAAHHMVQVARVLAGEAWAESALYACCAAAKTFDNAGIGFIPFDGMPENPRAPRDEEIDRLMMQARKIIAREKPDIIVGGLSNTGNGLDEALGAAGREVGCLTTTLLDDRGPLFTLDGKYADHLLATSKPIMAWAQNETACPVHLIGSLKHYALSRLPADEIRSKARRSMGVDDQTHIVAFIAQSDAMEGHNEKFADLAAILAQERGTLPPFQLIVRVHPGAPRAGHWCYEEALRLGLPSQCDSGERDIIELLAACDTIFSCSSTSMTDYVWLSLGGNDLNAVPVYLLGGEAIRNWLVTTQGTWVPSLIDKGLAVLAETHADLVDIVHKAMDGSLKAPNPDRTSVMDVSAPNEAFIRVMRDIANQ